MRVLGIMSGTSCDGLDLCLVEFRDTDNFKVIQSYASDYSTDWKEKLSKAYLLDARSLLKLSNEWSRYVAKEILEHFDLDQIDLVSSHGHTVFHEPEDRFTYQLGSLDVLSATLEKDVVGDFRSLDVALGGQGAPLVPIGDHFLFSEYDVCLNLGGIANATIDVKSEHYKAGDIVPCNLVLNMLAQQKGFEFDDGGEMASMGKLNMDLFERLNDDPFFSKPFPKSLGREWVEERVFPVLGSSQLSVEDQLCTYTEHLVHQLGKFIDRKQKVLITGGGAYNKYLIERFKNQMSEVNLHLPKNEIIAFKEAIIFAFLGFLRTNQIENISSFVTGSKYSSVSGHSIIAKFDK